MPGTPGDLGLTPGQLHYATVIAGVGTLRHASKDDIVTAIMVALTESNLQNYANSNVPESMKIGHDAVGSDHKSVGLFQQQVGIWGSAGELMDPPGSAKKFYDALSHAPGGDPWTRAQAVQKSAFPDGSNYRKNYAQAQQVYAAVVDGKYDPGAPTLNANPAGPDWAAAAVKLGATLSSAEFWRRAGLFALGALLLGTAVWKITGAGKLASGAARAAVKVAL